MVKQKRKNTISKLNEQRGWRYLVFGLSSFLLVFFLIVIIYSLFFVQSPVEIMVIPYDIHIGESIGFDVGTDMLHFGQVLHSGTSRRKVTLQNDFTSIVEFKAVGDFAQYANYSDNNFLLPANEVKVVEISMNIPVGFSLGNYSGDMYVYMYPVE